MHLVPLQRPVTGDCAMRGTCYFQDERRGRRLKSADPRICRYVAENEAVRALPFKEGRCVTRPSGLDRGQATSRGGAHRSESWRLQGSVNDIRRGKSYINPRPSERSHTGDCYALQSVAPLLLRLSPEHGQAGTRRGMQVREERVQPAPAAYSFEKSGTSLMVASGTNLPRVAMTQAHQD